MSNFNPKDICIFCYTHRDDIKPNCSYGFGHEFPEVKTKQVAKADKSLCVVCGLHKRNPKYPSNGCEHKHDE